MGSVPELAATVGVSGRVLVQVVKHGDAEMRGLTIEVAVRETMLKVSARFYSINYSRMSLTASYHYFQLLMWIHEVLSWKCY